MFDCLSVAAVTRAFDFGSSSMRFGGGVGKTGAAKLHAS